ncbi:integrase, partial [Paraburkholderia sp. Tr-20389]|nr:integrase [Paraburkholderia sp. Tr-20389]
YLEETLGHVLYRRWTLADLKRAAPSLADAKRAHPAVFALLLEPRGGRRCRTAPTAPLTPCA